MASRAEVNRGVVGVSGQWSQGGGGEKEINYFCTYTLYSVDYGRIELETHAASARCMCTYLRGTGSYRERMNAVSGAGNGNSVASRIRKAAGGARERRHESPSPRRGGSLDSIILSIDTGCHCQCLLL